MTLSALGIFSAAGAGGQVGDYELIQTQILGSSQSAITFSNLGNFSSTYKHLQVRHMARSTNSNNTRLIIMRFNADTATNYNWHYLGAFSDGTLAVRSEGVPNVNYLSAGVVPADLMTANTFGAGVLDILDAYSTTKNKTIRSLAGFMGGAGSFSQDIRLSSGAWRSTSSITSIELSTETNFAVGTRISLYGIRG